MIDNWPFVIGAYAVVIVATVGVSLWCWWQMRRAEASADALGKRR